MLRFILWKFIILLVLTFIAWSAVLILRVVRRIEAHCLGQARYIEERRAESYCKDNGLVLCPRCKLRPKAPAQQLCEWCGI